MQINIAIASFVNLCRMLRKARILSLICAQFVLSAVAIGSPGQSNPCIDLGFQSSFWERRLFRTFGINKDNRILLDGNKITSLREKLENGEKIDVNSIEGKMALWESAAFKLDIQSGGAIRHDEHSLIQFLQSGANSSDRRVRSAHERLSAVLKKRNTAENSPFSLIPGLRFLAKSPEALSESALSRLFEELYVTHLYGSLVLKGDYTRAQEFADFLTAAEKANRRIPIYEQRIITALLARNAGEALRTVGLLSNDGMIAQFNTYIRTQHRGAVHRALYLGMRTAFRIMVPPSKRGLWRQTIPEAVLDEYLTSGYPAVADYMRKTYRGIENIDRISQHGFRISMTIMSGIILNGIIKLSPLIAYVIANAMDPDRLEKMRKTQPMDERRQQIYDAWWSAWVSEMGTPESGDYQAQHEWFFDVVAPLLSERRSPEELPQQVLDRIRNDPRRDYLEEHLREYYESYYGLSKDDLDG